MGRREVGEKMKSEEVDVTGIPPCGVYCKNCIAYKDACKGCVETGGKPYYSKLMNRDVCPVWVCADKRKVEHCGMCDEFPSDVYLDCYSRRRGITTVLRRAGLLALRRKIGDKEWVKWLKEHDIQFGT